MIEYQLIQNQIIVAWSIYLSLVYSNPLDDLSQNRKKPQINISLNIDLQLHAINIYIYLTFKIKLIDIYTRKKKV